MPERTPKARTRVTDAQPRPWKLIVICAVSGFVCAAALVIAGWTLASHTTENADDAATNCTRIHRLVETLDTMIASGATLLVRYEQEGTITDSQLERALAENNRQRDQLAGADCPPRNRQPE